MKKIKMFMKKIKKKRQITEMNKKEFVEYSKKTSGRCVLNAELVRDMLFNFLEKAIKADKAPNVEEISCGTNHDFDKLNILCTNGKKITLTIQVE